MLHDRIPSDPWGHACVYRYLGIHTGIHKTNHVDLYSVGLNVRSHSRAHEIVRHLGSCCYLSGRGGGVCAFVPAPISRTKDTPLMSAYSRLHQACGKLRYYADEHSTFPGGAATN